MKLPHKFEDGLSLEREYSWFTELYAPIFLLYHMGKSPIVLNYIGNTHAGIANCVDYIAKFNESPSLLLEGKVRRSSYPDMAVEYSSTGPALSKRTIAGWFYTTHAAYLFYTMLDDACTTCVVHMPTLRQSFPPERFWSEEYPKRNAQNIGYVTHFKTIPWIHIEHWKMTAKFILENPDGSQYQIMPKEMHRRITSKIPPKDRLAEMWITISYHKPAADKFKEVLEQAVTR